MTILAGDFRGSALCLALWHSIDVSHRSIFSCAIRVRATWPHSCDAARCRKMRRDELLILLSLPLGELLPLVGFLQPLEDVGVMVEEFPFDQFSGLRIAQRERRKLRLLCRTQFLLHEFAQCAIGNIRQFLGGGFGMRRAGSSGRGLDAVTKRLPEFRRSR